jgi:signal transduction histidine kinase
VRTHRLVDVALTALALGGTLALLSRGGLPLSLSGHGDVDPLAAVLALGTALPVLAARRFPLAAFAATTAAAALLEVLGYAVGVPLGPACAVYLLAAGRPWARATTAWVLGGFLVWLAAAGFGASEMFHGGLAIVTGWFAGERTRLRRAQIAQLEERARRAEEAAERERRLAVAEERARIARDLHDSAGHAINVIAVRAGAARLRDDPERSRRALEAIEELARETLGDFDQILRTLRETAPPGLASLETLLAQHNSGGLDVTLRAAGPPRALAGSVDQAAYRILQEALTNAARHGAGTARVEVVFRADAVELTITNPVRAGALPRPGHGLIGMRERATLIGGSLDAGREDGTFRVHAALPYA